MKRFVDGGGCTDPTHGKRIGRPRKTTERTLNVIRREVDNHPRITSCQLKENNPNLLDNVPERTVRRRLHNDLHFRKVNALKKPLLTLKQRKNRVVFCKKYLEWGIEKFKTILWSDEATTDALVVIYRRPGSDPCDPKFIQATVKHPDSLILWGAFTFYGTGKLAVLPRNVTVNKERYLEMFADNLADCFDECRAEVFMQHGAPCHTAKIISGG